MTDLPIHILLTLAVFVAAAQPVYLRLIGGLVARWRRTSRARRGLSPDRVALACLLGVGLGAAFGPHPAALALGLGLLLSQLVILDCRYLWLPRRLTLPLLALGLMMALPDAAALQESAIGAAVAFAAFGGLRLSYRWLRGREGLGAGDATLMAGIGAWVGPGMLAPVALIAAVLALSSVAFLAKGRDARKVPLGAWLCVAFWLVWASGLG
jgi:leader peptidase (prepilin peptidase)/N-methyltransferase